MKAGCGARYGNSRTNQGETPCLNKHNFAIAKLAPKESTTRYFPTGVKVTPDGTAVTDGHMAVTVSATSTIASEFPFVNGAVPVDDFVPFVMRRADAEEVAKQAPKKQTMAVLDHIGIGAETTHNGHVQILTTDLTSPQTRNFNKTECAFPDIARVTPNPDESASSIYVDADQLVPMLQQAQKFQGKARAKGIKIRLFGPGRTMRVDATNEQGQEFVGILMPLPE